MSHCYHIWFRHWIVTLASLAVMGCQTTANPGPIYKLQAPEIAAPSAPVAVSISDKRPAKERDYRPGAVEPVQYQDGIETLTLDNFEPQVTELLKEMFAQRLSLLSTPPVWADVEVTRFRAMVDRREILAAEYERELLRGDHAPSVGIGVGMGGAHGGAGSIVGGAAASLMAAAQTAERLREVDEMRSSWDHAFAGVTCEIEMDVTLHWQDGRRETFHLEARSHSMPQDDVGFADLTGNAKWNIAPTVEQALAQISNKLQTHSAGLLGTTPARLPQATIELPETLPESPEADPMGGFDDEVEQLPPPLEAADPVRQERVASKLSSDAVSN